MLRGISCGGGAWGGGGGGGCLYDNKAEKSFGLHVRAAQPSETRVVCTRIYESLATRRNSNSDTSHSWCRTQTVTHPSTNVVHCCLISVNRQILMTLCHNLWRFGDIKKKKTKKKMEKKTWFLPYSNSHIWYFQLVHTKVYKYILSHFSPLNHTLSSGLPDKSNSPFREEEVGGGGQGLNTWGVIMDR